MNKRKFKALAGLALTMFFVCNNIGAPMSVIADIERDEETVIEFVYDPDETVVPSAESEETTTEFTENIIDETESSIESISEETSEIVFEETSYEENVPTDSVEETTVESTTESSIIETTESSIQEETTTEATTEVVEPSEEPTELSIVWNNMQYLNSQSDFIDAISDICTKNRIIFFTDSNIDGAFTIKEGVSFEGAYVVSFENTTDMENAILFLTQNGIEYSIDGVVSVCGTINQQKLTTQKASNGFTVAIIDTGSNSADEKYSVINGDGSDSNGHGTAMTDIVKESGAYVISIQAIKSDGKGQIIDVYNAVQLAESMNVDYILLSLSARDLGSFESFKELISNCNATVVASAGNHNRDASLYVPANISNVKTIGALNDDQTKLSESNYGSSVNYWVKASSTSEAAALYIKYLLLNNDENIYTEYSETAITPEVTPTPTPEEADLQDGDTITLEDGTVLKVSKSDDGLYHYTVISEPNNVEINAVGVTKFTGDYAGEWNKTVTAPSAGLPSTGSGTDTGTATLTHVNGGFGYITGLTSTGSSAYKLSDFITGSTKLYAECTCHRYSSESADPYKSAHAASIPGGSVKYTANWSIVDNGLTRTINWTVYIYRSTDSLAARDWTRIPASGNNTKRFSVYVTITSISGDSTKRRATFDLKYNNETVVTGIFSKTFDANATGFTLTDEDKAKILNAAKNHAKSIANVGEYTGNKGYVLYDISDTGDWYVNAANGFVKSITLYDYYWHCDQSQIYVGTINSSKQTVLKGDMVKIKYDNKTHGSIANKTYTLYKYNVNSSNQPTTASSTSYTATTNSSGIANFGVGSSSMTYDLGWYGVAGSNGDRYFIYLFNMSNACYKVVYYSPDGTFANATIIKNGEAAPYDYTIEDTKIATVADAFPYTPTHSVTLNNRSLQNTTFCIEPDKYFTTTSTSPNWNNYYSTSTSVPTTAATINECLPTLTHSVSIVNLCKILGAYNGMTGRPGSVSTTYTKEQLQRYMWYLMGVDGYDVSSNNLSVPTYTPVEVSKGSTDFPFSVTNSNSGSHLVNGSTSYVTPASSGSTTVNFTVNNTTNFNSTNFQVTVANKTSGGSTFGVTASIPSAGTIRVVIPQSVTQDQLKQLKITVSNKSSYRMGTDGAAPTTREFYAFSRGYNASNSNEQKRFTAYYYTEKWYYSTSFTFGLTFKKDSAEMAIANGDTVNWGGYDLIHFCIQPAEKYVQPPEASSWSPRYVSNSGSGVPASLSTWNIDLDKAGVTSKEFCMILMSALPTSVTGANQQQSAEEIQRWIWQCAMNLGAFDYGDIVLPSVLPDIDVPTYNTKYILKNYSVSPYSFYIYSDGTLQTSSTKYGALNYSNASALTVKPGTAYYIVSDGTVFQTTNFEFLAYDGDTPYAYTTSSNVRTFKRSDGSTVLTVTRVGYSGVGNGYKFQFASNATKEEIDNCRFTITNNVRLNNTGGTTLTTTERWGVAFYQNANSQNRVAAFYEKYANYYDLSMSFKFKLGTKTNAEANTEDTFTFTGPNPDITIAHFCIEKDETYSKPPETNSPVTWSVYTSDSAIKSNLKSKAGIDLDNLTYTGTDGGTYSFTPEQFCKTYMTVLPKADTGANVTRTTTGLQTWIWNLCSGKTNILPTATTYTTQYVYKGTCSMPYSVTNGGNTYASGSTFGVKPNQARIMSVTSPTETNGRAYRNRYFDFNVKYTGATVTKTTTTETDANDVITYTDVFTINSGGTTLTICTLVHKDNSTSFTITPGNLTSAQMAKMSLEMRSNDRIRLNGTNTVAPVVRKEYGVAIYNNSTYQDRIAAYYKETADYYQAVYTLKFEHGGKATTDIGEYYHEFTNDANIPITNVFTFCAQRFEIYPGDASTDTWTLYTGDANITNYLRSRLGIDLTALDISPAEFCKQLYSATAPTTNTTRNDPTTAGRRNLQSYVWYLQGSVENNPITTVAKYTPTERARGAGNVTFGLPSTPAVVSGNSYTFNVTPYTYTNNGETETINLNSTYYEVSTNKSSITASISATNKITVVVGSNATVADIQNVVITVRTKTSARLDANGGVSQVVPHYGIAINVNSNKQNRVAAYYYETLDYYTMTSTFRLSANSQIKLSKNFTSGTTNLVNNPCYNMAGDYYTVYSNSACTTILGKFQYSSTSGEFEYYTYNSSTDSYTRTSSRNLEISDFTARTLYMKESRAGYGYPQDTKTYQISITSASAIPFSSSNASLSQSGNIYTLSIVATPGVDPLAMTIEKVDTSGQVTTANLSGAQFTLKYYASHAAFSDTMSDIPAQATNTYTFNYNGSQMALTQSFVYNLTTNGDYLRSAITDLRNQGDTENLPYGIYFIYESAAPSGYTRNDSGLFIKVYTYDGSLNATMKTVKVNANGTLVTDSSGNVISGSNTFGENGAITYTHSAGESVAITVKERPVIKNYTLTKEKTADLVAMFGNDFTGLFKFELYNMTDNTLIATGTTNANGEVEWQYAIPVHGASQSNNSNGPLLNGTYTSLELAVYNNNNSAIQYQVRETIPQITYGNTSTAYNWKNPTNWTRNSNGYFYRNFTLSSVTQTLAHTITNKMYYGSISLNKTVPAGDQFDRTKVTFEIYKTSVSGDKIATGTVDSNGNINWTKIATTGMGTSPRTSVNAVSGLPNGQYVVREVWDKSYINSLDSQQIQIIEANNSGWTLVTNSTQYIYQTTVNITVESGEVIDVTLGSIENWTVGQNFGVQKTVNKPGDVTNLEFELYYIGDNNTYIKMATGTAQTTTSAGTFNVSWTYPGTKTIIDGLEYLYLPAGNYEVREKIPSTNLSGHNYSYMNPTGFSRGNGYFYKTFSITERSETPMTVNVLNRRIEGNITINKTENVGFPSDTYTFEIYDRGYSSSAQNVGDFSGTPVKTVQLTTTNGSGSVVVQPLPTGWYEIREVPKTGWDVTWDGDSTNANTKLVHIVYTNTDTISETVSVTNTMNVPISTNAKDFADDDQIISGSSTSATIVDTVSYDGLIPGTSYTITGTLMVKSTGAVAMTSGGQPITTTRQFTATSASGTQDVSFTFDPRPFAGEELVVFEQISKGNVVVGTHEDLTDEDQTIYVELLITVKVIKVDSENTNVRLQNAEITLFNADGTTAVDVNDQPCVGMTNSDGEIEFVVQYDKNNQIYVKETNSPPYYQINLSRFDVIPNGQQTVTIQITDIPSSGPNPTGFIDNSRNVLIGVIMVWGTMYLVTTHKKKKRHES